MKQFFLCLSLLFIAGFSKAQTFQTFHDFSAPTIFEDTISMAQFAGKKLMVVNTASLCGYTPQFAELQELDSTYESYNFEVIGFPCNDFSNQDPQGDSSIWEFCSGTYGVTFQMMSKVHTVVGDTAPIYKWLQRADLNGVSDAQVAWNFNKFLIDEQGHWVAHYSSNTRPFNQAIINWITTPSTSSINEKHTSSFQLLENPVVGQIHIQARQKISHKIAYQLVDAQGKTVLNGDFLPSSNTSLSLDVQTLPNGFYYLQLQGESIHENFKIVLK
jgi:glutathione peroxidase